MELKLPSAVFTAAGTLLPILPPAQLPGPIPTGPLNLPGPFQPNAFAPGSFVEPVVTPGVSGGSPITLPGVVTAGAVVLFFGALIPSDSGIKQIDRTQIGRLIDKFTAVVRQEEERLNRNTFNGNWSEVEQTNENLFKRIAELKDSDPFLAFKLLKIAFGRTIEDAVAFRVLLDPELDDAIDRVGGANQPDFRGNPIGPLEGFSLDITTEVGLQSHLDRKDRPAYGRHLIIFTYERWFKDTL